MRTPDTTLEPNTYKYLDGHRQLRDLRPLPTAEDNRPVFYYDNISDKEKASSPLPPWRVLRWHPTTGVEVCAVSPDEVAAYEAQGYVAFPPNQHPATVNEAIQAELASLSPADRELVLSQAKAARMEALTRKLAGLSDADLATVSGAEKPAAKRKGA